MALSKSSVLHYWSSRFGINPRVGGRPSFTRNSAGLFTTQEGEVDTAIVNTPRFDWATLNLPNSLTERRKVLTLELASTNIIDVDFASWTLTNLTPTTGQADPAGGTLGQLLNSTVAGGSCARTFAFTTGTKGYSLRLKAGSAALTQFGILANGAVWRGLVSVTWSGGVPALSSAAGSPVLFPVEALGGGYYEIQAAIPGVVSSDTNAAYFFPGANSGTGSVYSYKPQIEAALFCTSLIGGFAASRAADSLYWNFPPVPQAMMMYARFVEQGSILSTDTARIFRAGSAAAPRLLIFNVVTGYSAYHNQGTAVQSALAAASVIGDTVELLLILFLDGSIQLVQSINGAAVSSGAQSAANAFAAAWSDTRLYLNEGSTGVGSNKFAEIKVVKYADVVASTAQEIMNELRAFELGPNGDVL